MSIWAQHFFSDDMDELFLTSVIPPSVNHYLSYRAVIKKGRPLAVSYKPKEVVEYRKNFAEYVTAEVEKQGYDYIHDGKHHFYVDAIFYMPRVDMDANNYWKVLLDAITDTQLVWKDDNVVCERVQAIYYDPENPRIELHIYPTNYIGIFDTEEERNTFVDRCSGCIRYKRNCSILKRAKEGRIQDDIINKQCHKYKEKKD